MKEPILSRAEVQEIQRKCDITFFVPDDSETWPGTYINLQQLRDYTARIESALLEKLCGEPRAEVTGAGRRYPDVMTADLRDVLGRPNFWCGPIAHEMRAAGADIKTKAEDEQAHVLHWLVKLVLDHGTEWQKVAARELRAIRDKAARRTTPDREAIIEECAKVCDKERVTFSEQAARNDGRNSDFAFGSVNSAERLAERIRALKAAPFHSPCDTLIEEIAEMVDHMGEGRRLEEYVGAIREMKSGDKGGA
ncbi:hypothetical protein [Burkholderia vietnamiensis]|uniref:hypothetical protein n=1 Tax=Burkholderia vietnamiensis TaxID=60552 RepID=UPI001CAD488A|nr:hypothetical protein [Burkholderia vietnamiensis]CAG9225667.1 hypothetical protein BVI434_450061 [Burkholderia vietnamiensis]